MLKRDKLKTVPDSAGVYIFKDARNRILYVGKAKSLRTRVRSYFRPRASLEASKQKMVRQVVDIETIVCDSENEALMLEATLIHQYQPPYNIVLRDDKFYLFIKITTNEATPRVFPVRRLKHDGAKYFGPYSSAASVRQTLRLLRRIFPYEMAKKKPRERIFAHPLFAPLARGDGDLTTGAYRQNINNIISFLQGDRRRIISTLRQGMTKAAKEKRYEQAAVWRDQLKAVERLGLDGRQKVYLTRQESFDVVSISSSVGASAANVFAVRQGKLVAKNTFLLTHRSSADASNVLKQFLCQYYRVAQDVPSKVYIPFELPDGKAIAKYIKPGRLMTWHRPKRGTKKKILEMGELNARHLLEQEVMKFNNDKITSQAVRELGQALAIKTPLRRIETYDVANIQGKAATGSMVVFTDGRPNKAQYRKFRIKTADKPNDYCMLAEVLARRFQRSLNYRQISSLLPNLVLVDGGKGQLNAVRRVLANMKIDIPLAAVAKREEEIFLPGRKQSVRLPFDSPALFLVQRMRDEAHRFTVTYHRLLRSKRQQRSILDEVPGVGPKTKRRLLSYFGSLKAIRAASDKQLNQVIGPAKTKQLRDWL